MPLTAKVKAIPWGVLTLEFVVVVVGILGALWVDSWQEDRGDRRREARYLTRLHQDLRANRETLVEVISRHENTEGNLRLALEELRARSGPRGIEVLRATLGSATDLSVFTPEHSTYEEMVATGNLGLITNDSLRIALSRYDRWLQRNSELDAMAVNQEFLTLEPVFWDYFVPTDLVPPEFESWPVTDSPFPLDPGALYGNQRLWNVLNSRLETEMASVTFRRELLAALNSAETLIERELELKGRLGH
jgi:hypothetical protein